VPALQSTRSAQLYFSAKIVHIEIAMPIPTPDLPAALYQDLVTEFLAELMLATRDEPTQDAFQGATQAYCDSLRLWLEPGGCPTPARDLFPLFEDYTFDEHMDQITVRLSHEGYAFFRAWLRCQIDLVRAGAYPRKGWSN
jgi:hypothetical protein